MLYTKPRHEKKTNILLEEALIETFLPMREEIHQWADRKKKVEVALFTSYLFVHVNEKERMKVLGTDGAMKYVHFGGKIAVIRAHVIEQMKLALSRNDDVRLEDTYLEFGKQVKVMRGPLQGLEGILLERRGQTRVAIQIEAIRQMISVEVPVGDLVLN